MPNEEQEPRSTDRALHIALALLGCAAAVLIAVILYLEFK